MTLLKNIPWICVVILCILLLWSLNTDRGEPVVITKQHTDTLVVVKHDTTVVTVVKVVKEPSDTVYIKVKDEEEVPIPRQEYTFSEQNLFDFRVKGYGVEFLDAKIYPKTVYKTIVTENTTTVTRYRSSLFVYGGFSSIYGDFSPKVGLGLSLKGKWLISGDVGVFQKEPIYCVTVGYNILNK